MLLAVIFAFSVWLMSLARSFMMDLMAILFTTFFSQRIVTIYFFPASLDYQDYLSFTSENFTLALAFLSTSAFASLSGYLCARIFPFTSRNSGTLKSHNIAPIEILGKRVPFDKIFSIYGYIAVLLIFFNLYLMIFSGVGLTGLPFEREFAIAFRISNFFSSIAFLPFLVILSDDKSTKNKRVAILIIVLIILLGLLRASKGVILGIGLTYLICHYMVRGSIPKKYIQYAFIGLIVTIILYAPLITIFRASAIQYILTGNLFDSWANVSLFDVLTISEKSFGFLQRLGGFDWLLGLMNVGREQFPWWASTTGDLLMVLKTLWPGDALMFIRDYVPVATIIPELLRGFNMEYHLGHGELMGVVGMAYIYWGPALGIIFFFIWVFILTLIYKSKLHIIYKVIVLNSLLIIVFIGSGFITPLLRGYEAVISIAICCFIYWIGCSIKRIKSSAGVPVSEYIPQTANQYHPLIRKNRADNES